MVFLNLYIVFLILNSVYACEAQFCSAELTKLLMELQKERR